MQIDPITWKALIGAPYPAGPMLAGNLYGHVGAQDPNLNLTLPTTPPPPPAHPTQPNASQVAQMQADAQAAANQAGTIAQQKAAALSQAHGLGLSITAQQLGITVDQLRQEAAQAGMDPILFGQQVLTQQGQPQTQPAQPAQPAQPVQQEADPSSLILGTVAQQLGMTPAQLQAIATQAGVDPVSFGQSLLAANAGNPSAMDPSSSLSTVPSTDPSAVPGIFSTVPAVVTTPVVNKSTGLFGLSLGATVALAGVGLSIVYLMRDAK